MNMIIFIFQLEIGGRYEIVLTTPMGLTRYRLGDVIQVTGFFNQCPTYKFQYRYRHFLMFMFQFSNIRTNTETIKLLTKFSKRLS